MVTMVIGQHASFFVATLGSDGAARPASFSVKVSDYSKGFVALSSGNKVFVIPRVVGTFDVTVTATSQDGSLLPPVTRSYAASPIPVPQADHIAATEDVVENWNITVPGDPGTDTVTGSL